MAFKISKSTEYGILWCRSQGKSVDEIHEELNISKNTIKNVFEANPIQSSSSLPSESERSFQRPVKGTAMLTEQGSQIGEGLASMCDPNRKDVIFRPYGV